jgi:hypothetical protein
MGSQMRRLPRRSTFRAAFPKLRAGPYQDNLAIQVIDEVI